MKYEKKYKEALERAKKMCTTLSDKAISEYIFPELKESEDDKTEPKPYFYCKYGGTMPLCSDCIRNHNNSSFKTEEIATWYAPQKGTKQCIDFIQQKQLARAVNPADEVKPKFHEGDWIVDDIDTVYQIKEIKKDRYLLQFYNSHDVISSKVSTIDNDCHLWTIKDAKYGDVLVHNGCTFIFMGIKNGIVQALEEHFLDGTNPVCFGEPDKDGDYHPATKEQRDNMMKAMADAGYTFDFDKKELKNIEQKSAEWNREDEQNLNACLGYIPDEFLRRWLKDVVHFKYDKPADKVEPKLTDGFGQSNLRLSITQIQAIEKYVKRYVEFVNN